ncbi:hypothetical protein [Mesobacillus stamsii]|uniref:Uncharacterized protein n=1 Tax=Mesobacillus stamsii TaxID=225347 RepID=A0ABU0G199_9BACI|nr:hypothetical protein [Mesobacillus stamsii]MDQ0415586.1 hypothetical protein [Mesobacillus stamsii]
MHNIPVSVNFEHYYVLLSTDTPQCFSLYAQSRLKLDKLDLSIPQFDGLSSKEMVESGRMDELEHWLEQYEFNSYMIARELKGAIKHTEDFNWIRKDLGLPLSPFVSNYATRETSIAQTIRPKDAVKIIDREIPYFKQLGFTPETATEFYG